MNTLHNLTEFAEKLQYDYENQIGCDGSNVTYYSFADSAKDFVDSFLTAMEKVKVYVVIEQDTYEYDVNVYTKVFSTREKAKEYWKERVELALSDAESALDEDDMVVDRNDERFSCNIYKDGEASQWEANIWVEEQEINFN